MRLYGTWIFFTEINEKAQKRLGLQGRLYSTKTTTPSIPIILFRCICSTINEHDIFLQGLIDIQDIKRRRARKESPRGNTASFKYHLLAGSSQVNACLKALVSGFGVMTKSVRRITKLKQAGNSPKDKRCKFVSYSLPRTTKLKVREHIQSFPLKESHYCGKKMYFLSTDLDLKTMHKLYLEKYDDKVSYSFYRSFFRENFNYRFVRPQVVSCCTCEELTLKIKSPHLNEVTKRTVVAELMFHTRRSRKSYSALQFEQSQEAKEEGNVISLSFDFMQNIILPKVPVNVFCITDIKARTSYFYIYHEGEGGKYPDEVCSFLHDYVNHGMKGYITAYATINDLIPHTFFMLLGNGLIVHPNIRAYEGVVDALDKDKNFNTEDHLFGVTDSKTD
ncbi:hypothetical protein PR048_017789 [Dryococelus australis]|uniref:Uncharacterized protein n=1 Tax=Dryococelus australis TaxID=614101 RepID=A0ABQ9HAF7_9NEOP|nr:hypothetical protein PR048_017789 [Dryococelus australis]